MFQHAPYEPFKLGRPGHFVRLSPDALAACVSSIRHAKAAHGTSHLVAPRAIS